MLLVQEKRHPSKGLYFTLPGGKQEPGESLTAALTRECREEIGADVTIGDLLHVAEVHRLKSDGERRHQLDFVFGCTLPDGYLPMLGSHPDPYQVATRWITVEHCQQLRPAYVTKLFSPDCTRVPEVYLGPHDD